MEKNLKPPDVKVERQHHQNVLRSVQRETKRTGCGQGEQKVAAASHRFGFSGSYIGRFFLDLTTQ